jgi:hypothetical protein
MRQSGKIVRTVGVAAVCVAVLGISGCGNKDAEKTPEPTVSKTPAAIDDSKAKYTEALKRAKAWQPNAELARVYRKFSGTLAPSSPTPLVFAFSSLAEPRTTFEVEFQGDNLSDRTVKKLPFELLFNPVDVSAWKIPPEESLRIAENNGGEEFRERHLAGYSLLQQLSKVGAHPLQWYFRYDSGDGSKRRLEVYVDAGTGSVDFKKSSVAP